MFKGASPAVAGGVFAGSSCTTGGVFAGSSWTACDVFTGTSCTAECRIFAQSSCAAVGGTFVGSPCRASSGISAGSCKSIRMMGAIRRPKRASSPMGESIGLATMNEDSGSWYLLFFTSFGSLLIQLFRGRAMVGRKDEGSNNQSSGGP